LRSKRKSVAAEESSDDDEDDSDNGHSLQGHDESEDLSHLSVKQRRRLLSNRAAAQRSREKKRRTIESLSQRVAELEQRNALLVNQVSSLQQQLLMAASASLASASTVAAAAPASSVMVPNLFASPTAAPTASSFSSSHVNFPSIFAHHSSSSQPEHHTSFAPAAMAAGVVPALSTSTSSLNGTDEPAVLERVFRVSARKCTLASQQSEVSFQDVSGRPHCSHNSSSHHSSSSNSSNSAPLATPLTLPLILSLLWTMTTLGSTSASAATAVFATLHPTPIAHPVHRLFKSQCHPSRSQSTMPSCSSFCRPSARATLADRLSHRSQLISSQHPP
jgi:hypothetical protein